MWRLFIATLLVAGCTSGKADSLVVVTVDATQPLMNVALLYTKSMAGGQTFEKDVGGDKAPFSLGDGMTKSFGVQVPSSITGAFSIYVEARDASGKVLAAGNGMTTLAPGSTRNITIVLGAPALDGGTDDGGPVDGGPVDGGPVDGGADMPAIPSSPAYVGAGGAAASSAFQLSVGVGGTDTFGTSNAPSGASFTSGFFSSQTE
jgi:hypothetical protein